MFHTDSSYVTDMATELGPTSIQSITQKEGAQFWLNRFGYYLFEGATPTLVSNNIQPQIYNDAGSAIAGTIFDNAPSGQYKYGIYTAVGTVTDDFSNETVTNAIQKYDYQLNEWSNYAMGTNPTAFHTYKDAGGIERFIFGDGNGQCYTFGGTALADNGKPVQAIMEMVYAGSLPEADKRWSTIWLFFNPGCQAQVQVACDDTFHRNSKKWIDLGDASSGMIEFKFPANTRSKLIYIKISESSPNDRFVFYGFTCDYAIEEAYANN